MQPRIVKLLGMATKPRVAELIQSGEGQEAAIERAPGVYEARGVGNSYLLTTPAGDVLVNAGTLGDARRARALFAGVSSRSIQKIVLTQSHPNQFGGLELFKTPDNEVIAQRRYPAERRLSTLLAEHYRRGSRRFFAGITRGEILPTREVEPDLLIDVFHAFELGGRRFELHAVPGGETRSALLVWLPEERIALVGNLFGPLFGNQPNLNTLRGDKPRSALEFIASAEKLRALAPELILTGHEAIDLDIDRGLTRIIDAVQWVHDRTVEGMNAGTDLRTLMRELRPPPELTLYEEYGTVAWNVRAIWHEYSGWFDPTRGTSELYGSPRESVAPAIVELAGVERLCERARAFLAQGAPLEALQLADLVMAAAADDARARSLKREVLACLQQQADGRNNLWERRWLATELRALEDPEC